MKVYLVFFLVVTCTIEVAAQVCNPIAIAKTSAWEVLPMPIYNSIQQNFLSLWYKSTLGDEEIYVNGRIVSDKQLSVPRNLSFAPPTGHTFEGSLTGAFNEQQNEFLVIWFELGEGSPGSRPGGVYHRRINAHGIPIGPSELLTPTYMFEPRIVYNAALNEYLVGYTDNARRINTVVLSGDGKLIQQGISFGSVTDLIDSVQTIVPIQQSSDFLIFWDRLVYVGDVRKVTTMVQRISSSGIPAGPSYPMVKNGIHTCGNPPVIFNSSRNEFLALICGKQLDSGVQVQAVRVGIDGKALEIPHTVAIHEAIWPAAIAFNTDSRRYGILFSSKKELTFRELGPLGNPVGTKIVSCGKKQRDFLSLMYAPAKNNYLAEWSHSNPQTHEDVFARFISPLP